MAATASGRRLPAVLGLALVLAAGPAAASECVGSGHLKWRPYSVADGDRLVGGAHDLAAAVLRRLGTGYRAQPEGPWKRVFGALMAGQVDIVAGAFPNAARQEEFRYSAPFHEEEIALFVRQGQEFDFRTMEDLAGRSAIGALGTSFGEAWDRFAAERLTYMHSATILEGMRMLAAGRADFMVAPRGIGEVRVRDGGLAGAVVALDRPLVRLPLHFVFRRDGACAALVERFDAVMAEMRAAGEVDALLAPYAEVN